MEVKDQTNYWEIGDFDNLHEIISFFLALRFPGQTKNHEEDYKNLAWYTACADFPVLWDKINEDKDSENSFWSFRGQRNRKWNLSIRAPRLNQQRREYILKEGVADGVPEKIPQRIPNDKENYDTWFDQYKKRMVAIKNDYKGKKRDDWSWYFYAQQHGLHTRLLDWSSNPLVAIYFAVEDILSSQGKEKAGSGAVWALKVGKENFLTVSEIKEQHEGLVPATGVKKVGGKKETMDEKKWFMINPEPITKRIVLQSAKFSYHPGGDKPKAIDKMKREDGEVLLKITINPDKQYQIRRELGVMNIHHASLFPSPTGAAKFIIGEWPDIAKY